MIWKFIPLPVLACGLAALLLGLFTLGPYMHETDQGILLAGGVAISQGHLVMAQGDLILTSNSSATCSWAACSGFSPPRWRRTPLCWPATFLP